MKPTEKKENNSINDFSEIMVIAADVYDNNGKLIMPKDTMISGLTYNKLRKMGIKELYIRPKREDEEVNLVELPSNSQLIPVTEKKEYKKFQSVYSEKTKEVKSVLNDIGNGKIINLDELYKLTDNILENIKYKSELFTYMGFLELTDESTFTHSNNVSLLCNVFGQWLGYPEEEIKFLTTAGLLHDIGKTKIPSEILNKPGKLTNEEFEEMKKHPMYGYRLIEKQSIPDEIKLAALMHHEKIDGSGYPLKIKGDKISKYAKIVAICDIYDAMTANRIYRKKMSPFQVIKTFEVSSYGQLDTEFLLVFLKNIAYNYLGAYVELSNGKVGEIVFINKNELSRPIIQSEKNMIDLSKDRNIDIVRLI